MISKKIQMNRNINIDRIISSRCKDDILNSEIIVDKFITINSQKKEDIEVLEKWKDYFDEYNISYIITKEPVIIIRKGVDKLIDKYILWKHMPY